MNRRGIIRILSLLCSTIFTSPTNLLQACSPVIRDVNFSIDFIHTFPASFLIDSWLSLNFYYMITSMIGSSFMLHEFQMSSLLGYRTFIAINVGLWKLRCQPNHDYEWDRGENSRLDLKFDFDPQITKIILLVFRHTFITKQRDREGEGSI